MSDNNSDIEEMLEYALNNKLGKSLPQKVLNFNDEPRFFGYTIHSLNPNTGELFDLVGAMDTDSDRAYVRTIGELIERSIQRNDNERTIIPMSVISKLKLPFLAPSDVFPIDMPHIDELEFQWIEGYDIYSKGKILLPLPSIHLGSSNSYKEIDGYRSTNGCAFGIDESMAIENGLCELIERDCFFIHHLAKITPPRVDVVSKKINKLINKIARYRLDVELFDISLDCLPPTYLCVLIDKTGIGPRISIGTACDLNPERGIEKAILEAQQIRLHLRYEMIEKTDDEKPDVIATRMKKWIADGSANDFSYILNSTRIVSMPKNNFSLEEIILKFPHRLYVVDLSPKWGKNWKVLKLVSPELVPLYFDDNFKPIMNERLRAHIGDGEVNEAPHPFL